jgi:hypothetical protein
MIAALMLSIGAAYAQSGNPCLDALGKADCDGPHRPAPNVVNDLRNAIAFSPSHIIAAAHDICLAVAYERSTGGAYRIASGVTKQDAEGKPLPVCLAEGPKRCGVLARCSGQPPILIVGK